MMNDTQRFSQVFEALQQRRYFKLICGGSFSDTEKLRQLIHIYAQAGVAAVDVSAHPQVVEVAIQALASLENAPMLMVSFPLDDDPHFRKIQLDTQACILCEKCIPVCPTRVFSLAEEASQLAVDTPLCYGCDRCVPACPVDALSLDQFSVRPGLTDVLSRPEVQSVEIHAAHCDPYMVSALYAELGDLLADKLISICFRPQQLAVEQAVAFVEVFQARTPFPLIIQVDGKPMSATDDPEASREALESARRFADHLPSGCYLTVSGGINRYTAHHLQQPCYAAIQGVGMGTFARQQVWNYLSTPVEAVRIAATQVKAFQSDLRSAIMELKR